MSVRYAFLAEWADTVAACVKKYTVCFYADDNTVEMIDNKSRRVFLRRTAVPNQLSEFFIGGAVTIYGRQLKVTGYADAFTAAELGNRLERTLLLIKPDAVSKLSSILTAISSTGLSVVAARMAGLGGGDAGRFGSPAGKCVGLEIVGNNAVGAVAALAEAGANVGSDAVYASDAGSADGDLGAFFGGKMGSLSCSSAGQLCLIKPSLFGRNASSFGDVLAAIAGKGFEVTGLVSHTLDRAAAEEFLEVYKGVVSEYTEMVNELTSGPVIALEVSGPGSFRDAVGPSDPEIAKQLRPDTLRARFGSDKVNNGLHCTDLPDDVSLELEYFFSVLA